MALGKINPLRFPIERATTLVRVDRHKVLGFWFNSDLLTLHHHQPARKMSFCVLNLIHSSATHKPTDCFHMIYENFVRPSKNTVVRSRTSTSPKVERH